MSSSSPLRRTAVRTLAVAAAAAALVVLVPQRGRGEEQPAAAPTTTAAPAPAPTSSTTTTAPAGDTTFTRHSDPGAHRTIYLDFDGGTVRNTRWNGQYLRPSIVATPFSRDADPGFSDAERAEIVDAWTRVAEDFAPFAVDVTTEAPPASAIDHTSTDDVDFGAVVMVTNSPVLCGQCRGAAFPSVFDAVGTPHTSAQPAWVYPTKLPHPDGKDVGEEISHLVGRELGLADHGTKGVTDYAGAGVWAPIMGDGTGQPVTQWSDGSYPGSTDHQDDLALITAHGLPYRPDDVGDTNALATPLVRTDGAFRATGLISTRDDVDVFAVQVGPGNLSFTATPLTPGPDLDLQLTLEDAHGRVWTAQDPTTRVDRDRADGLRATIDAARIPPGTYYVKVEGVGTGDPANGGFTDYGSLGDYDLVGVLHHLPVVSRELVPYDYDGDGLSDPAVFRPGGGAWLLPGQAPVTFGTAGDIPVPGHWAAGNRTIRAVFRPSNGRWYVESRGGSVAFGQAGDIPVPADYDGDGLWDIAVFRPSTGRWYVQGWDPVAYGTDGDIPVPGDWIPDDDYPTDFAVYRPSNGRWYVHGLPTSTAFGSPNDIPVPWVDAAHHAQRAVFRPSTATWFFDGEPARAFGQPGQVPVPAQWAGTVTSPYDLATYDVWDHAFTFQTRSPVALGADGDIPLDLPYAIWQSIDIGNGSNGSH